MPIEAPLAAMPPTIAALVAYAAWTLALLVLMELVRSKLVLAREVEARAFRPDNANLSPFMQRLARAHANCLENLPIAGALMLAAVATGNAQVTDPLAWWLVAARVVQSLLHLASLSNLAVTLRFAAFAVQVAIAVSWAVRLLLRT